LHFPAVLGSSAGCRSDGFGELFQKSSCSILLLDLVVLLSEKCR
jgi:hypothetical protein